MNEDSKSIFELFKKTEVFQNYFYFSISIHNSSSFLCGATAALYYDSECSFSEIFTIFIIFFYSMILIISLFDNFLGSASVNMTNILWIKHACELIFDVISIALNLQYTDICCNLQSPHLIFSISFLITQLIFMLQEIIFKECFKRLSLIDIINKPNIPSKQNILIYNMYTISHASICTTAGIFVMCDASNIKDDSLILFKLNFWLILCIFGTRGLVTFFFFKFYSTKKPFFLNVCEKMQLFLILNSICILVVLVLTIVHFYNVEIEKKMLSFYFRLVIFVSYYSFSFSLFSCVIYSFYFLPKGNNELKERGLISGISAYILN